MNGNRLNYNIITLLSGFLFVLLSSPVDAGPDSSSITGNYKLNEEESDDFLEAFEDQLEEMGRITRRVARVLINRRGGHAEEVKIEISDDTVIFQADENDPIHFPADGSEITHINDSGDEMKGRAELEGNRLRISMMGDSGGSVTEYQLNDNGDKLNVDRKIEVGRLAEAVEFQVVYDRAG